MEESQENPKVNPTSWLDNLNPTIGEVLETKSIEELWKNLHNFDNVVQEGNFDSTLEKEVFVKIKQQILARIEALTQQEANRHITDIHNLVEQVKDADVRTKLLTQLEELEQNAKQRDAIIQQSTELERERQRTQMQLDADDRRAKTRMLYFDRFLERESAATLIGGFLLFLITVALLISMIWQEPAREIIYNGFLILLGYFFGQTAGRAASNRNSGDS